MKEDLGQSAANAGCRRGAGKGDHSSGDHQHQIDREWREGKADGAIERKAHRLRFLTRFV
ncbi:hypothetical protein HPP92_000351 [Vanilla planifolia]|uniref:Uncharacterized protein n=1 Tax=Vanilla planifolia TaxID=51239 RepID=A0A835S2P5_VANPL|nr:hypothetical protein HPP92_000351 [Vanilla planifolia]